MTAIVIADVTTVPLVDSNCVTLGTGSFDVLMESVNLQISKQWELGRITGADYASVYLGALQAVLQQSVQFSLNARTAALQADEILAGTVRNDAESAQKVTLLKEQHESEAKNNASGGVIDKQILKISGEIALLAQKLATELTNTVDPVGGAALDKKKLMAAQSLGFANNTKQSVLKTMLDGYSTNLAIAGVSNVPESTLDGAIDQLSQNILDSLTTTNAPVRVQIQTVAEVADVDIGK